MLYQLSYIGENAASLRSFAESAQDFGCGLPASPALGLTPAKRLNIGEKPTAGYSSLSLECIVSFRRTQVLNANMAKIAKHSSLTLSSSSVVHASTPNPTNAAIAIAKRVTKRSFAKTAQDFGYELPLRSRPQNAATLVHREGFEPSYLARRDRFTVCWL